MFAKKLRGQLLGTDVSNEDEKHNALAERVHCLDKQSILMLKSEWKGNGQERWTWLMTHFSSSETPPVMILLEQLTSQSIKLSEETESQSSSLQVAGENIFEKLLLSVVHGCLPDNYE